MGDNKNKEMDGSTLDFEYAVLRCWLIAKLELEEDDIDVAPSLDAVYEHFLAEVVDEFVDIYENVFGFGAHPRADWMSDLGCHSEIIVGKDVIVGVLNKYRYPYYHQGLLFGFYQQRLLRKPRVILEDYNV